MKKIFTTIIAAACFLSMSAFNVPDLRIQEGEPLDGAVAATQSSAFVTVAWDKEKDFKVVNLGELTGMDRFSACFRNKSCWMNPAIGKKVSQIPNETQFLLADMGAGEYMMVFPLVDKTHRSSLTGSASGLKLVIESGDKETRTSSMQALYLIKGNDPYEMIHRAMTEIADRLQTFKLRDEKEKPWFAQHLGWCSWNAFYNKVNYNGVEKTLQTFKEKDIPVEWILIDDGMQRHNEARQQNSFEADTVKFPGGLRALTDMIKGKYGLKKVMTWHTCWGFWMGVDPDVFGERTATFTVPERYSYIAKKGKNKPAAENEATVGPGFFPAKYIGQELNIPGPALRDFYEPYYDYLRRQGVDGTKIDAMTWIECLGQKNGGRVKMMKELLDGVGQASSLHFGGDYINCSSCSNDFLYNALVANVTRSSGDFFPGRPETHGFHIYTNAHTSFWMGEVVLPDWDMFQSGHVSGLFHAAARAISGGPIYTTEEVGTENPEVLKAMVNEEGRILQCTAPGRIAKSSFFTDPTKGKQAVNIWNTNKYSTVIGTFNCSYDKEKEITVKSEVPYSDICAAEGVQYVVYDYQNDELKKIKEGASLKSALKPLEFNLYTFAPVAQDFAPLGTLGKLNMGGAVTEMVHTGKAVMLQLISGGNFLAWSKNKPSKVLCEGQELDFTYKAGRLEIAVPEGTEHEVYVYFR